jgi:hypothetical protein
VIGVAVFTERRTPTSRIGEPKRESRMHAPEPQAAESAADAPTSPSAGARADAERSTAQAPLPAAKLGTGHGRSETSYARHVQFERSTSEPVEVVALQYDRYENLVALGVIDASPRIARMPRPFPGARFVPDPR